MYMGKVVQGFFMLLVSGVWVSCFKETPVPVVPDFEVEIVDDDYSVPVTLRFLNKSTGADLYEWTFEGGEPEHSTQVHPDDVVYKNAGTHTVRLEAWNTTERKVKEWSVCFDSAIHAGFTYDVQVNRFSPVEIVLLNTGYGGSRYDWEFEGGVPQTYEGRTPPPVVFTGPGLHKIRLQVSNARETVEFTDTLFVLPALSVDFAWQPGKDDYDMEAPLQAEVSARCKSALSYSWKAAGARIENDTSAHTRIYFDKAGVYDVVLEAANGKETKRVTRSIHVLENSNLYKMTDLQFGITTALNTVGGYYFSKDRSVLTTGEITSRNGPDIDLVFWGLVDFIQCSFLSPDAVSSKALPAIPGARRTWVINNPEILTPEQFDGMENDALLRQFAIKEMGEGDTDVYFSGTDVPHIILFETGDHRKGAIKIKEVVYAGNGSYVLADMKIQKEAVGY